MRFFLFIALACLFGPRAGAQEAWTIERCIQHALENNIDLAIQDKTNALYDLQVRQSKFAFGPSVNAQIDYTQAFGRSIDITTNSYQNQNILSNRYLLSGSIDLFNGGRTWNQLKKSKLQAEAGEVGRQVLEENIQLEILTVFLTVLRAREQLTQAETTRQSTLEQLERTRALIEEGVLASNADISLTAQLAADDVALTGYRNEIARGLTQLKLLLRLDPNAEFDVAGPQLADIAVLERALEPIEAIYEYALQHRPEIRSSELAGESAAYDTKIARGAHYPVLTAFASVSTNFSSQFRDFATSIDTAVVGVLQSNPAEAVLGFIPTTITSDVPYFKQLNNNLSYAVGLSLAIPIFNKNAARLGVQRAMILENQALLQTGQARQNLYNTLREAYNNALLALDAYRAAAVTLEAADRSVESERSKLDSGIGTNLEFQLANNQRSVAASRLIEAKYDYLFNIKYLDFFQGKPLTF